MPANMRVEAVTGAAQGIGRRTAEVLAGKRYAPALLDVQPAAATSDAVRRQDAEVLEIRADVSAEDDVERAARQVEERYGRADVLVNNAGVSFIRPAEETGAADWRRGLGVNLPGPRSC